MISIEKNITSQIFNSAVELNIGIVCACMPVAFVLFKTFAQKTESSYKYLLGYILPRPTSSHNQQISPHDSTNTEGLRNEALPRVPKGTLSGLVSFMRTSSRSQHGTSNDAELDGATSAYFELTSIDYDYHSHLKGGKIAASRT